MSLDFVGFDVETANWSRGSICAMGLVVVIDGKVERIENWLCQPPGEDEDQEFDPFNVSIHGITWDMVKDQPTFAERLDQALGVIGDLPVIAHNAAFDMGALRDGCDTGYIDWPTLRYGCTVVLSRRAIKLLSYKLPLVCEALEIPLEHHHDAAADALAASRILLAINERQSTASLDDLVHSLDVRLGRIQGGAWAGCVRTYRDSRSRTSYGPLPDANTEADPGHPLYGQTVVFTGALGLRREDAWAAVAALGATPEDSVTKRTTFLVVGDGFTGTSAAEFQTGKAQKAAKWMDKGHHIEVLTEDDFMQMLSETSSGAREERQ